jgi:hypothetical protein
MSSAAATLLAARATATRARILVERIVNLLE